MAKTNTWPRIAWVLVLAVAVWFGWHAGRYSAATAHFAGPAKTIAAAPDDALGVGAAPKRPDKASQRIVAGAPSPTLPHDLDSIAPEDFSRLLPALKALAAQGRGDAAYAIYRHFDSCVGYRPISDGDIEAQAQKARERAREIVDNAPAGHRFPAESQPEFRYDEVRRQAFGLREQCAELGIVTGGEALDWAIRAMELDDDSAIRFLSFGVQSLNRDKIQGIRYAERLAVLQRAAALKLNQRIARGDLDALRIYASALRDGGLFAQDIDYAYALMYARSLFPPEPNGIDYERALAGLADTNRIRDIEAARARGIDIARACCGYIAAPPGR